MSDGKIIYEARVDGSKIDSDLDKANQKVKSKSSKIIGAIGKGAATGAVAIGASFVAATGAAIKFGGEFEQSLANASTLFGNVDVDRKKLTDGMLELSNKTGIASKELGDTLYNALSAGIPASEDMSESLAFLESNAKLAKAGFTDIDSAVGATAKVLNAYGMDVKDTEKVHKVLMQTQNNGITTIGELSGVLANVTPTASAMGVSFEQVGAALATMTAQGTPTAQATTQLNNLLAELGKEGTKASNILRDNTGQSFKDLMDSGYSLSDVLSIMKVNLSDNALAVTDMMGKTNESTGANYTYEESLKALGLSGEDTNQELINMFGSIEAGKAALSMSGEKANAFKENLSSMSTEVDVVGEAFDKVTNTTGAQFNQMLNKLKNAGVKLFVSLSPIINELLPLLSTLIDDITPILADISKAILPVILDLLKALMPSFKNLVESLMPVLQKLFEKLLPPILQLVESALPLLVSIIEGLLPIISDVINLIAKLIQSFVNLISPVLNIVSQALKPLMKVLGELNKVYINLLIKAFENFKNASIAAVKWIYEDIRNKFDNLIKVFTGLIEFIEDIFTGNWESAWNKVTSSFGRIFGGIQSMAKRPLNYVIGMVNSAIKGLNRIKLPDWVPNIGGKGVNIPLIPKLAKGGLAFGETLAMVGDNPNARIDPEVIAPLSKLEKMIKFNVTSANGGNSDNIAKIITEKMPDFNVLGDKIARNIYNAIISANESKGEEHIHISMDGEDIAFGLEKVKKARGIELYE